MGSYAWEKCCRKRWPSVKPFSISASMEKQMSNKWYECYRRMHLQDMKASTVLSILLSPNKTKSECIDALYDLFCSDISIDQLFDGLLFKLTLPNPAIINSSFKTPSKVMAGLMLLEVNQSFSMQRLCNLWRAHGMNTPPTPPSSSSVILQGAIYIAQFCQSVSELIQRKSLYALEEELHNQITEWANLFKSKLDRKRVQNFQKPNELYVQWVEEMKYFFSKATEGRVSQVDNEDFLPMCGNKDNYYDWHNSLLDKVVKNRKGIPITLCIIYAAIIYHALGLDLDFIGLPGHFLLRLPLKQMLEEDGRSLIRDSSDVIFIDAYNGGRLYNIQEVMDIVEIGYIWSEAYISPLTPDKIWTRMIANIVNTARDFSTPSQTVLLHVIKRRITIANTSSLHENNFKDIITRFFLLSTLCSFEPNDILALSNE